MSRISRDHPTSAPVRGVGPLSRRTFLGGVVGLGSAAFLPACTNEANQTTTAPTTSGSSASAFPVEIEHKYGTTVVSAAPQRIACVGLTEQDGVLALGSQPVAVTEWFGNFPYATWPWAQSLLTSQPEVLSYLDGIQIERVAQTAPDLILAINAGLGKGDYKKLSAIAPVVAQSGQYDDWFEPWQVQSTAIGRALGKEAEMQQFMSTVDSTYASAAEAHPEFQGKQAFLMAPAFYDGSIYVYQEGVSTDFLTDLGLVIPAVVKEYDGAAGSAIPKEDLVDVLAVGDVVVWLTTSPEEEQALKDDPIIKQLKSTKEGSNLFTGLEIGGAVNFNTILSLPWLADKIVPQLASILGA